jgi:molybdopterin molybdotransferase
MLSVEDALARVLADVAPTGIEHVSLSAATGRTLAEALPALRTQPPQAVSAMDGYALRSGDATDGARLAVIGAAPAGHPFGGAVGEGETVRIFTGAVVPGGADAVVIQENVDATNLTIRLNGTVSAGANIRPAGIDFHQGETLLPAGTRLTPRHIALAAAGSHPSLPVHARPKVAVIATGDELRLPGETLQPGQIIASNSFAIAALAQGHGAEVRDFGIVPDRREGLAASIETTLRDGADVIVTLGGASVGEHDLVRGVLNDVGVELDFWKIAMRPGKPLMLGRKGATRVLGLPGNPVSSYVCAQLFLLPLLAALQGRIFMQDHRTAILARPMPANGPRQHYARARITGISPSGLPMADIWADQDSSLLVPLAGADCLIVQPANAAASMAGEACAIIML